MCQLSARRATFLRSVPHWPGIEECAARGHDRSRTDAQGHCRQCRVEMNYAVRRDKRQAMQDYKLNAGCARCGYDACASALHFHHLDPAEKDVEVSRLAYSGWTRIWAEIAKCEVICANCHAELHEAERSDTSDPV